MKILAGYCVMKIEFGFLNFPDKTFSYTNEI